jgi:hypothetical protein
VTASCAVVGCRVVSERCGRGLVGIACGWQAAKDREWRVKAYLLRASGVSSRGAVRDVAMWGGTPVSSTGCVDKVGVLWMSALGACGRRRAPTVLTTWWDGGHIAGLTLVVVGRCVVGPRPGGVTSG